MMSYSNFDYLFKRNFHRTNFEEKKNYHLSNPDLTFEDYKKLVDENIEENVKSLKKIYLDTSIWINIEKAIYGPSKNKNAYYQIFTVLKSKVAEGKLACPFSDILFEEVLKQSDRGSRRRIGQIADIIASNLCIKPFDYIIQAEILNLFQLFNKIDLKVKHYKWSRPISLIGEINLASDVSLVVKKLTYDAILLTSFQEIIADSDEVDYKPNISIWQTEYLNKAKQNLKFSSNVSIDELHINEFISCYNVVINLQRNLITKKIVNKNLASIIEYCPTTFAFSGIYAYLQKDTDRKIKLNDFYDICHSSIALGTCDYLFTEKSFRSLLKAIKLDAKFNIPITSDPNEMLEILSAI